MLPTSTARAESVDAAAVYEDLRQELIDILRSASADELDRTVAATPAWRVRDVLAHVAGITYDLNRQDLAGDTDRQVDRHRDDPIKVVIAEWDREAPAFEEGLRLFGYPLGSHFVADLHAHLQDIRTTLGLPRHDDPATVLVALDFYLDDLDQGLRTDGGGLAHDQRGRGGPSWSARGTRWASSQATRSRSCGACPVVAPSSRSDGSTGRGRARSWHPE